MSWALALPAACEGLAVTPLTQSWGIGEATGDSDMKEVVGGQRGQEGAGQRSPWVLSLWGQGRVCQVRRTGTASAPSPSCRWILPLDPLGESGVSQAVPQPPRRSTLVQGSSPLRPGSSLSFPTCPVEKVTATFPAHQVAVGTVESGSRSRPRPGEELHEDPQRRPGPAVALLLWPACLSHAGTNLGGALLARHPAASTMGRSVPSGSLSMIPREGVGLVGSWSWLRASQSGDPQSIQLSSCAPTPLALFPGGLFFLPAKALRGGGIWGAGFGGTRVGQGRAAEVNVVVCLAQSCRP